MAKNRETLFVCANCGNEYTKWQGQCSGCGEWNILREVPKSNFQLSKKIGSSKLGVNKVEVINLGKLKENFDNSENRISTKIGELDRVLGKGVVRGSVVLFSGEPGIGKSTLLTQLVGNIGGLYVAGEESAGQIGLRVKRLGLDAEKFDILGTNSVDEIITFLERTKNVYNLVVVDSIQVMVLGEASGTAGSPSQIRECAFRLIELAKRKEVAIFIVGHVTKGGDIAGPKLLEHMVDTVLYFEGERSSDLRIVRAIKNRFGATDEVGVFQMEEAGLKEVRGDEINLVSGNGGTEEAGKAVTIVVEGTRPMCVEVQALVVESFAPMPKRVFSGIDYNRGQLLVAVAQKALGIPLYKYDVFVSVTGGIRVEDTGADAAVIAAMWSSYKNKTISKSKNNKGMVYMGEVSLLGEVRKTRGWEKRVREVRSLGRELFEMKNVRELKTQA